MKRVLTLPEGDITLTIQGNTLTLSSEGGEPIKVSVAQGVLSLGEAATLGGVTGETQEERDLSLGDTKPGEGPEIPGKTTAGIESRRDGQPQHGPAGQATFEKAPKPKS